LHFRRAYLPKSLSREDIVGVEVVGRGLRTLSDGRMLVVAAVRDSFF